MNNRTIIYTTDPATDRHSFAIDIDQLVLCTRDGRSITFHFRNAGNPTVVTYGSADVATDITDRVCKGMRGTE